MRRLDVNNGARGFSVIELMIATAVMAVVFMSLSRVLVRTQSSVEHVGDTSGLRQYARTALARMTREVRFAGYNLKTAPEAFTSASATQLAFAADIDLGDAGGPCTSESGDDGVERITYRISGSVLERAVDCWTAGAWATGESFQPLADDVDAAASSFNYFDLAGVEIMPASGSLTAVQRAEVRRVRITLTLTGSDPAAPGMPAARHRAVAEALARNAGGAY